MKIKYLAILLITLGSCKEKYVVHLNTPAAGYLVVEGFINISGTTDIMMTRSSGLDTPRRIPEPGAQLEIQSPNGASYPLSEAASGHYIISGLSLDPTQQYKLYIRTANGKEYESDMTNVNITPPIDSVNWKGAPGAIDIFVSTHDNQVQTGYYQWQFEETWKYSAKYNSLLEYDNNGWFTDRPINESIYTCWRSALSTNISIANTEKLSSNVIYQFPLTTVSYGTDKLIDEYSILVKQFAISKDWYNWALKIKRNSETVGSIFDPQPSETTGNIHGITDPAEIVIGYIGCTTESDYRIFIDRLEIPPGVISSGYDFCQEDTIPPDNSAKIIQTFSYGANVPTRYFYRDGIFLIGIGSAPRECVDCREKGGTTVKPSFWP